MNVNMYNTKYGEFLNRAYQRWKLDSERAIMDFMLLRSTLIAGAKSGELINFLPECYEKDYEFYVIIKIIFYPLYSLRRYIVFMENEEADITYNKPMFRDCIIMTLWLSTNLISKYGKGNLSYMTVEELMTYKTSIKDLYTFTDILDSIDYLADTI